MAINPSVFWITRAYVLAWDLEYEAACAGAWHDEYFSRQYHAHMQITLPNLAILAGDMHLPVNTSVGPQRRKWEVVRDYVIAQDHVHLRAETCIDGIDPHWDAIRQCYHLNRPYDWDGFAHASPRYSSCTTPS